jgi:hypothetical protein
METITCTCKICKANAAKLGKTGLSANVPSTLLAAVKGKRHGLVYSANDPSIIGKATRDRLGISAA